MGNPQHFSRELPRRGQQLIDCHYESLGRSDGGGLPLKATFLLSISMPMVILPYERIKKTKAHMNDGTLDPALASAMAAVTGQFKDTTFFQADTWEHAVLPKGTGFPNLADGLPEGVANALDQPAAKQAAADLSAEDFLSIVRNALAHGCVLFLNSHGRTEHDVRVERFAFVGTDKPGKHAQNLLILRTSMKGYRIFLESWSGWLRASGVQKAVEEVVEPDADDGTADADEPVTVGA